MDIFLLDSCVAIARIKTDDDNHRKATDFLSSVPSSRCKLMSTSYYETSRILQKNNMDAIKPIKRAWNKVGRTRRVNLSEIPTPELIDEVIEEAYSLAGMRHEAFYSDISTFMKENARKGQNPFEILSIIVDNLVSRDVSNLKMFFDIEDPSSDCMGCRPTEVPAFVEMKERLSSKYQFFENKKNSSDLKIAAEFLVLSQREDLDRIILVTTDRPLYDALVDIELNELGLDPSKIGFKNID